MNTIVLSGNVAKEPVVFGEFTKGSRFRLAVHGWKDETMFVNIVCFGKTAEAVTKWVRLGMKICVMGRLEIKDKQTDGKWDTYVSVVAEDVEFFLPPKEEGCVLVPEMGENASEAEVNVSEAAHAIAKAFSGMAVSEEAPF